MPENAAAPDMDDLIRLSVFSSIGTSIVSEKSIRGVLDRVMEHVASFFGPLNWSLLLVDAKSSELVFALAVGRASDKLVGTRLPLGEGIAGWVAAHGTSAIVEDTAADARFSERMDGITGFRTESIVAVPLRSGDRVFGVIELLNRLDGSAFSAYDMRVLSTIADFAAIAVEKAYYLAEARRLSELDSLTGALNRRGLAKAIERETARLKRYGGELSVVLADVDKFKSINDGHGHATGDRVLSAIGALLKKMLRATEVAARWGGEEIVVALAVPDLASAEVAAERVRVAIESLVVANDAGEKVPVTASGGLALLEEGETLDAVMSRADRALYAAKAGGRNRVISCPTSDVTEDDVEPLPTSRSAA